MTSTTPRIIAIALTVLVVAAPAAIARPLRDQPGIRTSSLAGTTSAPAQDLRNADQQGPGIGAFKDHGGPDHRAVPVPARPAPAVAHGGDTSPFVYIIPGVVLIAMLGAGIAFARTSRPARQSPA